MNIGGTIVSLCDYSGVWSKPYELAGYEVIRLDLQHGEDVRLMRKLDGPVHGIMAAPPCTHFSGSGAWKWAEKGDDALLEGLSVVDACLRIIMVHKPVWWVLENPVGRLQDYLGPPVFRFDPCDFGDPWTKRTCLWGYFVPPLPLFSSTAVPVKPSLGSIVTTKLSGKQKNQRSLTPRGFAQAFFQANP